MKKIFKCLKFLASIGLLLGLTSTVLNAQILTLSPSQSASFTIVGSKAGSITIDWGYGSYVQSYPIAIGTNTISSIGFPTTTTGTIKITDVSGVIKSIDASNKGFTSAVITPTSTSTLQLVDLRSNALTSVVATDAFGKLTTINCNSNATLKTVNVNGSIGLTTLSLTQDNALQSINVSNTALTSLSIAGTSLTSLITTNAKKLKTLGISGGTISSLDLSTNIALTSLRVNNTKIANLNLTTNTGLTDLDLGYNQLSSLTVSANTQLTRLVCSNNKLASLNISNLMNLATLYCANNQLTSLNLSGTNSLIEVYANNNKLKISTITPSPAYPYIELANQAVIQIPTTINVGDIIDFSAEAQKIDASGGVYTTSFNWYTNVAANPYTLQEGVDYISSNGKFTFIKTQTSPVYCQMYNDAVSGDYYAFTTTATTVKGSIVITFDASVTDFTFTVSGTFTSTSSLQIDLGDGVLKPINISNIGGENTFTFTPTGTKIVKITGNVGELGYLYIVGSAAKTIDITQASQISKIIICANYYLTSLNASTNKKLTYAELVYNRLTDLKLDNHPFEYLSAYHNAITIQNAPIVSATTPLPNNVSISRQDDISLSGLISGMVIDLSKQSKAINGVATDYVVTVGYGGGTFLIPGVDYSISGGKITFLKAQYNSDGSPTILSVRMTNSAIIGAQTSSDLHLYFYTPTFTVTSGIALKSYQETEQATSVATTNLSLVTLYPNPTNTNITISNVSDATLTITNVESGYTKTIVHYNGETIDVSGFANGVYAVSISSDLVNETLKFTKVQ